MNARRLLRLLSAASIASISACATYQGGTNTSTDVSARIRYSNADYNYYDDYYDELSRYGTWEDIDPYGECWVPLDTPVGWRPYTEGYWVATDYGWMWISQDPWGGAPYHYGRWAEDDYYGWVWVPDNDWVWASAWVSWRYGDGYVGWAPLPPRVGWQDRSGLTVSVTVIEQGTSRDSWCFAPARDFGRTTRIRASVLPASRNVTLISRTQNVTRYEEFHSRPAERGLSLEIVQRDTGRRFQRYQVLDSRSPTGIHGERVRGRTVEVYRPSRSEMGTRRARTTTQAQAAPPRSVIQHLDEEQRQFDRRMQQERTALGREQERELKQRNQSQEQTEQIRQRHQAEIQAQQEREDRERRALDRKRKVVEDRQANKGKDRGQDKKDRDHGRSKDKGQDDQDQDRDRGRDRDRGNGGG